MAIQIAGLVPAGFLTARGWKLQRMAARGFEVEVAREMRTEGKKEYVTGYTATVYNQSRFIVARATVNGSRGDAIDEVYARWRRWRGDA